MVDSMARNVRGCAASSSVHAGMAITATTQDRQKIVHVVRSSAAGSFHVETNVGTAPSRTPAMLVTMPSVGLEKMYQSAMASPAPQRQH